jgi:nucleoside-diphosphate-sugar epimerase
MPVLLNLGHGYSAGRLAASLAPGWRVIGATRSADKAAALRAEGIEPLHWEDTSAVRAAIHAASHVLVSAAPAAGRDPVLDRFAEALHAAPAIEWIGYLSTTGVYGDHQGAWIDEDAPRIAASARGGDRVAAEDAWLATGLPVHLFRLSGIYGPGRSAFDRLRAGTAQRVVKPGQVFNRIHGDDIAAALRASIAHPAPGRAYNLADDEPAPAQDVIAFAADLLGLPVPPEVPFETADLSPMARSFYAENKRVCNRRVKAELGLSLLYPDYRAGLRGILAAGG